MQPLRSRSAVALVAAVIGGVLGNVPAADAAPESPPRQQETQAQPSVWPRPQSLRGTGGEAAQVTPTVTLVAAPTADPYALTVIRDVLREAGARTILEARTATTTGLTVYADGPAAEAQLSRLKAEPQADLPAGGYRLATGRDTVALAGVGTDGLFHAAQTLRQLLRGRAFAAALIRDWPTARVRGTAESYYGVPWTQAQRLSQLDFMGRTKQNRLLYAPGDDPYRQAAKWREPYPAAQRAQFRALADRAAANHVTLAWAVAPGQGLCFSSADDLRALTRKADAMWALGIRAFQLQFQDVSYTEWHCGADAKEFGKGPEAAARAQARLTNALADHLTGRTGAGAADLSLMPTEYYQDGPTKYRTALATALRPGVAVAWTGVGVVPERITGTQLATTAAAFKHSLLTVDNYPVNDYAPTRLFLGPYTGREPAVASGSAGVVAAAMQQPVASRIALFTAADYAWNAHGYDAQASWQAAIDDLAGPDRGAREALRSLAGNDVSSALGGTESAYLRPLLADFWTAYGSADRKGLPDAARRLRAAFTTMRWAPGRLAGLADGSFGGEVRPWLDRLALYGTAGERAVDMLLAQARGDGAAGWQGRLAVQRARTGLGAGTATMGGSTVLDTFLTTATTTADSWTGGHADARKAIVTQGSARATDPSLMVDGKDGTAWSSDTPPQEGDAFGVDLGLVRPVGGVRIVMGSAADSEDYLHDAVLEYSAGDDAGWRSAGAFHDRRTIAVRLPAGARARFVRLRATGAQPSSVAVRAFDVPVDGTAAQVVGGAPAARAVADDDVTTSYRPAGPDGTEGPLTVEFGAARPLEAVTVLTEPGGTAQAPAPAAGASATASPASVEVRVPGKGWQRVGTLADGWTELSAHGVTADAIRLTTTGGSGTPGPNPVPNPVPAVHEIVPWFTEPPRITLDDAEVDAEIGGDPVTVHAELRSERPLDTQGTLEAAAPKGGAHVEVPASVVVRRGAAPVVPVRVSVPPGSAPGTYSIPVRFTVDGRSAEQWITVRARPRTGGPDLVRGARATSSGDETPAFPAAAIADGDPETRWSSPVQDDAWVQVELAAPARVGRVVLHWQDAYAARYAVQTSADGVTWHTAATVRDGKGGTESVRLDDASAPWAGARFLRVHGVQRATKYSYSLFGVEAYAVLP
ncbi:beta-N-acetylglucosaminidase domain-containing protein [Streptomyces sp. RKAG337]|uniref:beta-N-acetylglucosaminidase domain-containing protein n=1 Tax=Streptomyces sp. RKAG337 TaxID=2893404 RepID=UPI002033C538|nr:beta-N-acetylglucosaminidase domain-containing protein [Streptomyces sp. RKAG337]MCM2428374.1 beta-N-acetylglucosaminidase domain-containing protein [Streptomyces sp. RKAG337]